jgi:hypothetical protein
MRKFVGGAKRRIYCAAFLIVMIFVKKYASMFVREKKIQSQTNIRKNQLNEEF